MSRRNTDQLYYLSVLAEEQSMTRAAERLYISQPALTAFVNRLEGELGVRLFDRSSSPIRLTEAGRYYITEMRRIEDEQNQLLDDVCRMDERGSALRIGIGRNRGALWLSSALSLLRAVYPDLRFSIYEDRDVHMAEQVARGMLDVAVIETAAYAGNLCCRVVGEEKVCLFTGADNPAFAAYAGAESSASHPADVPAGVINDQPFLCPSIRSSLNLYTRWLFTNYHLDPREMISVSNNVTAYQLALQNFGCTFLSTRYPRLVHTKEKPLYLMPGGRPGLRRLYAVFPGREPKEKAACFVDCLSRTLQEDGKEEQ